MTAEVRKGLSAGFTLLHSELNDFLFAEMGKEESGVGGRRVHGGCPVDAGVVRGGPGLATLLLWLARSFG
jgi:hypothetical protein